jgi:hypothetical protein
VTVPSFDQSYITSAVRELGSKDFTPDQPENGAGLDEFAHAAGRICKRCDRRIEAREPARRRGESGWVHDVCPD